MPKNSVKINSDSMIVLEKASALAKECNFDQLVVVGWKKAGNKYAVLAVGRNKQEAEAANSFAGEVKRMFGINGLDRK